jgi:hypothetical protein
MIRLASVSRTAAWLSAVVAFLALSGVNAAPPPKTKPGSAQMPATFPGPMLSRFLDGAMKGVEEIVFAVRVPGRDHWYVTFGNYSDDSDYAQRLGFKKEEGVHWGYSEGGRLCRKNLRTGKVTTIFEDMKGGVRDPQLSYDGRRILFAYRKGGTHPFHLYEINVNGSGLRQLTDGPDDDIEPTYCPDGSIVFCSSRCRRFVNCWYTRVATLYRCDADGGNVRMLSTNNDHDNTPWMLPDGRVLYMRWEYVDRSQVHFHHLWTSNPDGTGQTVYYGNMTGGVAMLDAKPIPGTVKVVASFSPGHGRPEHLGPIAVVDPRFGPDDPRGVRTVSKSGDWKDPYAFSEDCFLVAHPKGLFVMDGDGNVEMIHELPESERAQFQCHEPRPVQARPRETIIPARVDLAAPTGRLFLEDIYHGRNMAGVERGSVKKLLVLQQLPKPINFSGGMEPLTIGGSFTLAEVVGEAPVEPDGSAFLEVPAMRSLFFVALDKNDLAIKRMHSFVTIQPGETLGCVGCHENRQGTALPSRASLMAMKRPPSPVQPIRDVPSVLDFPRDIQPILDRHCVQCHNSDRREAKVDLSSDKTAMYCISYWTITTRGLVSDGRNVPYANRPPYSYGSAASRLLKLSDGSHHGAKLNDLERKTLRLWIETSATYPGTYASLGCGTYPVYLPYSAMMQRCGECHSGTHRDHRGKEFKSLTIAGAHGHYLEPMQNLSRPEKSLILRAPLAKEAGGLQLCGKPVFKDTNDPLYRETLTTLRDAHSRLIAGKRFDMPGFRPNEHYIREMQRFGILPKNLGPSDPVDIYATDRAYWNSFYHRPVSTAAR